MTLPADVEEMLQVLLAGLERVLGNNLVGVYLRGSLVTGDFDPLTSDVDVLVVTRCPVDGTTFDALAALHADLDARPNPFAGRLEVAYLDSGAVWQFEPGQRHPTLGQGETLAWTEHGVNWILERWDIRRHGRALFGPDPRTLIEPVPAGALRGVVAARLQEWAAWARQPDDPDWLLPRKHKAYVVETICRALYTLARGEMASKPAAVTWALETLPEPWRTTVIRARTWRHDDTADPSIVGEVAKFVLWAARQGPQSLKKASQ